MALTNKQKKIIKEKYRSKEASEIASELNLNKTDVDDYLKSVRKKTPVYFYIILLSIPILLIVLLEIFLNVFNYGKNLEVFVEKEDDTQNLLYINYDLPYRYFSFASRAPGVSFDAFSKDKTDSTFRVFVLGGSSAAGWPYIYNATFPKYIQRRLNLLFPDYNNEVVNLGITALNSFALNDIFSDIIDYEPDLILIYAGHNEYYGALGVGSSINYGSNTDLTNLIIRLRKYKITQLLENSISRLMKFFNSSEQASNETLMSRMIGENEIIFESELFYRGIEQFEKNISTLLDKAKKENINVIIGNLTSNLKQKPLISVENTNTDANTVFKTAESTLENGQNSEAKKLFLRAKDLDPLRFRAPELINEKIKSLSKQFEIPFVNVDSTFTSISPEQITGYNLMVDHLHPNEDGYNLMGKAFFEVMLSKKFLPKENSNELTIFQQDSIMAISFPYTKLDSSLSELRTIKLLSSYPFVKEGNSRSYLNKIELDSYIDSTAFRVLNREISWRAAHQLVADYYFRNGKIESFEKEMTTIISAQPHAEKAYRHLISGLVNARQYTKAVKHIEKLHKRIESDFSYKWLGSIELINGNNNKAIEYLEKSIQLNGNDAQVYYNLAGAYFNSGNLDKAKSTLEICLKINPNYKAASIFLNQLKNLK